MFRLERNATSFRRSLPLMILFNFFFCCEKVASPCVCVKRTILKYISKRKKLSESSLKMLLFFSVNVMCVANQKICSLAWLKFQKGSLGLGQVARLLIILMLGEASSALKKIAVWKSIAFVQFTDAKDQVDAKGNFLEIGNFPWCDQQKKNRHSSTDNTQKGFNPNQSFVKSSAHASRVAHKSTPEHVAMCFDDGCAPWSD